MQSRLKPAEKRILAFCVDRAETLGWFEVSQRQITAGCRVSSRDVTPILDRLAARGLILLKIHHFYRSMKRTEVKMTLVSA
jgi:DNA-binding MarR family transcriptional regulator